MTIARGIIAVAIIADVAEPQRLPPRFEEYGLPQTGEAVAGTLVAWEYWSFSAGPCKQAPSSLSCAISIGNGGEESRTLCVGNPVLVLSTKAPPPPAELLAPQAKGKRTINLRNYSCFAVEGHTELEISVATAARTTFPAAIRVALLEVFHSKGRDSTLSAVAEVPIAAKGSK